MKSLAVTMVALMSLSTGWAAIMTSHDYSKHDIAMLNLSVGYLAQSNPDLSAKLKKFTDRVSGETKTQEAQESSAEQSDDIKTLQKSADALRASHHDVAKKLDDFAVKEQKAQRKGMNERTPSAPTTQPAQ